MLVRRAAATSRVTQRRLSHLPPGGRSSKGRFCWPGLRTAAARGRPSAAAARGGGRLHGVGGASGGVSLFACELGWRRSCIAAQKPAARSRTRLTKWRVSPRAALGIRLLTARESAQVTEGMISPAVAMKVLEQVRLRRNKPTA